MKNLKQELELISNLSEEKKLTLEAHANKLKNIAGAEILIDSVQNEIVQLSVKNINRKRTSKYELFEYTYKLFSENIPDKYRLIIKV